MKRGRWAVRTPWRWSMTKIEENSPYTYLCSAGVVFKLAHALLKEPEASKTFDL